MVWTQQAVLTASDRAGFDKFGSSVALSGDTALVGAFWKASQTGAAYVFVRNGAVWTQQAKLEASDGALSDHFGVSVALSGDTALVGAYGQANYSGAAYVYVRGGTAWTQQAKLTRTGRAVQDYFGASVALSNDTALIGAYGHAIRTGAAHIYMRSGTVWTHRAILTASDGVQYDAFGYSVALSGNTAIVGAFEKANSSGAAYVYVLSQTGWTQQAELTASDGTGGDAFGISVAVGGGTAVVGAWEDDTGAGAAYVYNEPVVSSPEP
jgi:nucleoside-specific outer membrane channel protein Tsx